MSRWEQDVSAEARETMDFVGGFSPTVKPEDQSLKGYVPCGDGELISAYLTAKDLREMAAHFAEVANCLEARAVTGKS